VARLQRFEGKSDRGERIAGRIGNRGEHMTYAERSAATRIRDDEHMIYEMGSISQYEDGSVLDCVAMTTYTAEEVVTGVAVHFEPAILFNRPNLYLKDLRRNAKAAVRKGTTENFAPLVKW
jgi:hypothetical protein